MCHGAGTLYVPATSWYAMASNKPLPLAVVSIIRYPRKQDSASQESLLSLFGPPSLLANYDKYFNSSLPKIGRRRAPGAPSGSAPAVLATKRTSCAASPTTAPLGRSHPTFLERCGLMMCMSKLAPDQFGFARLCRSY